MKNPVFSDQLIGGPGSPLIVCPACGAEGTTHFIHKKSLPWSECVFFAGYALIFFSVILVFVAGYLELDFLIFFALILFVAGLLLRLFSKYFKGSSGRSVCSVCDWSEEAFD